MEKCRMCRLDLIYCQCSWNQLNTSCQNQPDSPNLTQIIQISQNFLVFRCGSLSSTFPCGLVGCSVLHWHFQISILSVSLLDRYRASADHKMSYIFWKVWPRPFHLTYKIPTYLPTYLPSHLFTYLIRSILSNFVATDIYVFIYSPSEKFAIWLYSVQCRVYPVYPV